MTQIVWVYKHCQLTVIERPAGGYHVEIVQIAGGKPVLQSNSGRCLTQSVPHTGLLTMASWTEALVEPANFGFDIGGVHVHVPLMTGPVRHCRAGLFVG